MIWDSPNVSDTDSLPFGSSEGVQRKERKVSRKAGYENIRNVLTLSHECNRKDGEGWVCSMHVDLQCGLSAYVL
jgi:hypothetical protein